MPGYSNRNYGNLVYICEMGVIDMKKSNVFPVFLAVFLMCGTSHAYNLITDIENNMTFPVGQVAQAGTAINLRNGQTSTSMLAQVAVYRNMLALSYGGTRVNQSDAQFTDTAKVGLNLSWVFSKFTNPLPAQAQFLKNINVGPSYAINLISSPRVGTPFMDISYVFGSGGTAPTPAPALIPTVTPAAP